MGPWAPNSQGMRRVSPCPALRSLRRHVADERGISLIMALGTLIVISVTTMGVLTYTASNSRNQRLGHADVSAADLAEAGLNEALSVVTNSGTSAIKST